LVFLRVFAGCQIRIWKDRRAVFLLFALLLVGPAVIGIRTLAHVEDMSHVGVLQTPAVDSLSKFHLLLLPGSRQRNVPGAAHPYLSDTVSRDSLLLHFSTLDDVYLLLLPFLALLLGANVWPHRAAMFLTLLTLPMSRSVHFLIRVFALGTSTVGAMALVFGVNLGTTLLLQHPTVDEIRLIAEFHLIALLYALVFGFVSVSLAGSLPRTSTALGVGLVLLAVLAGVGITGLRYAQASYVQSHRTALEKAEDLGSQLERDLAVRAITYLAMTPSIAYNEAVSVLPEIHRSAGGCQGCATVSMYRRHASRSYQGLLLSSLAAIMLGWFGFLRRKVPGS